MKKNTKPDESSKRLESNPNVKLLKVGAQKQIGYSKGK
jgi:hypothetical protein